jgi:predicted nucleic acid-binding protein
VPLVLTENRTELVRALHLEDSAVTTWWGTRIEAVSAIARSQRAGLIDAAKVQELLQGLHDLLTAGSVVEPSGAVAEKATNLLQVHNLRAGDALQLAAALAAADQSVQGFGFVCLDRRLREAAGCEGFSILPAELPALA